MGFETKKYHFCILFAQTMTMATFHQKYEKVQKNHSKWKNIFFQNCSKLPKNHIRQEKFNFFQILTILGGGWVTDQIWKIHIFLSEPFPYALINE